MTASDTAPPPRLGERTLFPDLVPPIYLQSCAIAPLSRPVVAAMEALLATTARLGAAAWTAGQEAIAGARERVAAVLDAAPDDIAFLPNTTSGVAAVAVCFPWRAGDRVLLFEGEFPANVVPWLQAARLHDLRPELLPVAPFAEGPARGLQALDDALRGGARMVATSAVQFQTGLAMPIGEMARLCHDRGAQLFVDGIQAAGVLPVDVAALGVDYLAAGSHKWMMGPLGCAALYARPDRAAELRPHLAGWASVEDAYRFLVEGPGHLRYDRPVRRDIRFLEGGTLNAAGLAGLGAAAGILLELGIPAIRDHVTAYLDALEPPLVALGLRSARAPFPEGRSAILALKPPEGVAAVDLAHALGARGVACTAPDGYLRLAPHWPNALDEVPRVVEACRGALAELR